VVELLADDDVLGSIRDGRLEPEEGDRSTRPAAAAELIGDRAQEDATQPRLEP